MTDDRRIDTLNSLLRGELAAVETYGRAIERLDGDAAPLAGMLQGILADHERAVERLRGRIILAGAEPADRSGPWGAFASALGGVASLAGARATLHVLAEGERQGLADYEGAVAEPGLDAASERAIRAELVPSQKRHIAALDEYLERGPAGAALRTRTEASDPQIEAIVGSRKLTREEKIERLQQLSYDARELEVATEEGMAVAPDSAPRLDRIKAAMRRLGVQDVPTDSKH